MVGRDPERLPRRPEEILQPGFSGSKSPLRYRLYLSLVYVDPRHSEAGVGQDGGETEPELAQPYNGDPLDGRRSPYARIELV